MSGNNLLLLSHIWLLNYNYFLLFIYNKMYITSFTSYVNLVMLLFAQQWESNPSYAVQTNRAYLSSL